MEEQHEFIFNTKLRQFDFYMAGQKISTIDPVTKKLYNGSPLVSPSIEKGIEDFAYTSKFKFFTGNWNYEIDEKTLFKSILTIAITELGNEQNAKRAIEWLEKTDFYYAPASIRYHESYSGGLLHHTLNVVRMVYDLLKLPVFNSVDTASAIYAGLVHDWCKIGMYRPYKRNVKNNSTGEWEQVDAYEFNQHKIPLGHGVDSMFAAGKFVNLSVDLAAAIRWHMGRWRVAKDDINELEYANGKYPIVHLIQFADQLSITNYVEELPV